MAEQRTSAVSVILDRGSADLSRAMVAALDAIMAKALSEYRMAGFPRPFKGVDRFYHLFEEDAHLSLCEGLAVARPDRLQPADLMDVDCVACLDRFTERMRP